MKDSTPTLVTERLTLVPFAAARHLTARYIGWLNDPDVVRYSEQRHRKHDEQSCRVFIDSFNDSPSRLWAIERTHDNLHIGNIHADIDPRNRLADVAILIGARDAWGSGLGFEAWCAVLDWLAASGDVDKIVAGCIAQNTGMLRIMEKSAMRADGIRKRHYIVEGERCDVVYRARFCPD